VTREQVGTGRTAPRRSDGATPNGAERARPEKIAQIVARRIAHDIAARRLPDGSKLPSETSMMTAHRVSRSTIREALRLLEVQGLIDIKSGRGGGPVVRRVGGVGFGRMTTLHLLVEGATFRDLVEARLALEPVVARLAAVHRTQREAVDLRALVDSERADGSPDDDGYLERTKTFHHVLTMLSGNPVLDLYTSALAAIFQGRVAGAVFPVDARDRVHDAHVAIAEAIITGDPDEAERQMREHMIEFVQFWEQQYPGLLGEVVDWV
jgi:GntR family transcriptional regulator, transcriptional repressor for pyruvate dehydrogenase complex